MRPAGDNTISLHLALPPPPTKSRRLTFYSHPGRFLCLHYVVVALAKSKESGPGPLACIVVAVVSNVVWSLLDNGVILLIGQSPVHVNNEQDEKIVKSTARKIMECDEDADGTI